METLCMAFVTKNRIAAPPSNETRSALCSIARRWQCNGIETSEVHLETLSGSPNKTQKNRTKLAFDEEAPLVSKEEETATHKVMPSSNVTTVMGYDTMVD